MDIELILNCTGMAYNSLKISCRFFNLKFQRFEKKCPNQVLGLPTLGLLGVTRHQKSVLGVIHPSTEGSKKLKP